MSAKTPPELCWTRSIRVYATSSVATGIGSMKTLSRDSSLPQCDSPSDFKVKAGMLGELVSPSSPSVKTMLELSSAPSLPM